MFLGYFDKNTLNFVLCNLSNPLKYSGTLMDTLSFKFPKINFPPIYKTIHKNKIGLIVLIYQDLKIGIELERSVYFTLFTR